MFALVDVDLTVSAGEVVCITGEESAGKTALLQCAAGLLKRDSGIIRWFGEPMAAGTVPPGVVFVSATPLYYPFLTVRDVVQSKLAGADARSLAWSSLEMLALLELDTRLNTPVADLDRMELRCLSVAEAIVQHPQALLIDTSPSEIRTMSRSVSLALGEFACQGGAAIIAVRDPLAIAAAATRIVVLHEGVIGRMFYSNVAPMTSIVHPPLLLAETLH
jgi:ABC-type multidrug transport system ATPase subunit